MKYLELLQVEDGVAGAHESHRVSVIACIAVAFTDEDELIVDCSYRVNIAFSSNFIANWGYLWKR